MKRYLTFLLMILSSFCIFSQSYKFELDTEYSIKHPFGPVQDESGEWFLSHGIVFEVPESVSIYCPDEGVVIANDSGRPYNADIYLNQTIRYVIIQFENSLTMMLYNVQSSDLQVSQRISKGDLVGQVQKDFMLVLYISNAPLGEFETSQLFSPPMFEERVIKYNYQLIDPSIFFELEN